VVKATAARSPEPRKFAQMRMSNTGVADLRRFEARDRRMAAIHEAGHVTMAGHVGLQVASASLERIPDATVSVLDNKIWIGKTRYMPPETIGRTLSYRKRAMFAVAGAVAERCWSAESFDEELWYDPNSMSESDWAGCGCQPGDPTPKLFKVIQATFSLFDRQTGRLLPDLLLEARHLIENTRGLRGTHFLAHHQTITLLHA
jgi:hypothetical protein